MGFPQNWLTKFVKSYAARSKPPNSPYLALDSVSPWTPIPTPTEIFTAMGLTPDPWQAKFLRASSNRQMVLACRRAGKSTGGAVKTLHHCLTTPNATAMVFSPTKRQSQEFARQVRAADRAIGVPLRRVAENQTEVEWSNGSRLLSMPDRQVGVVGFTPTLIVIDEAMGDFRLEVVAIGFFGKSR